MLASLYFSLSHELIVVLLFLILASLFATLGLIVVLLIFATIIVSLGSFTSAFHLLLVKTTSILLVIVSGFLADLHDRDFTFIVEVTLINCGRC